MQIDDSQPGATAYCAETEADRERLTQIKRAIETDPGPMEAFAARDGHGFPELDADVTDAVLVVTNPEEEGIEEDDDGEDEPARSLLSRALRFYDRNFWGFVLGIVVGLLLVR